MALEGMRARNALNSEESSERPSEGAKLSSSDPVYLRFAVHNAMEA